MAFLLSFPTCQVRVVRFCHSCSGSLSSPPPPRPPPFSPTTSAPTSTSTSALPTLRQSLPTSARRGHCWTFPAGFRSEWARAGPRPQGSERSGHRWTPSRDLPSPVWKSTWDLPSLSGQMECQNICQKDCQNTCQANLVLYWNVMLYRQALLLFLVALEVFDLHCLR